jgi:hypothetical protein
MTLKKYVVMSKFDSSDKFIYDKGFATRELANSYAKLMIDSNEYDSISYFCFEQTMDYDFYFDVPFTKKDTEDNDGVPF